MPPRQVDPSYQSIRLFSFYLQVYKVWISRALIFIPLCLILSAGCATIHPSGPQKQIGIHDAEKIVSDLKEKNGAYSSFYTLGVVSIKGWVLDADADILIAGNKEPFTVKIEITHRMGTPILHILIREGILNVLSFQEKLAYTCRFTPEALSLFLSGLKLDQDMIWSSLSGRPPVTADALVNVSGSGISLTDDKGIETEAIYLPPEGSFPKKIAFPGESLEIAYSELNEESGIPYAGRINISGKKIERNLTMDIKTISFNPSIPEEIFELEKPSSFKTVNLDETRPD